MTIPVSYEQVTYNSPDGAQVGKAATEKVGFFGATPIARPSVTWPNTGTATTTLNETKVNRIMAALVNLGLIVTT
jgi:hypothetical protein